MDESQDLKAMTTDLLEVLGQPLSSEANKNLCNALQDFILKKYQEEIDNFLI
jgi:hypothetical protein